MPRGRTRDKVPPSDPLPGAIPLKALLVIATLALAAPASAGCKQNFSFLGLPLLSQIEYRTHDSMTGVSPKTAAKRIAAQLKAEGYFSVKTSGGTVTALQETSGSGRAQSIRFVAKAAGDTTRIDAIFTIQQGQIAGERVVRNELCRLISVAAG